jgi:uncharacterized protein YkwD
MTRPTRQLLTACLGALAAAAMLAPASASAGERCLFQGAHLYAGPAKVERALLCLTNLHRLRSGAQPLQRDSRLAKAARAHSADMVSRDYFDHFTPEGAGPSERARAAGYPSGAGENIAANGTGTAFSLLDQWVHSSGHNRNMLSPSYRAGGFGVAAGGVGGPRGITGTQDFGISAADTGDTALDLYASSGKCAKAKLAKMRSKGKKKRRAKRKVRNLCKPPPGP